MVNCFFFCILAHVIMGKAAGEAHKVVFWLQKKLSGGGLVNEEKQN